MNTNIIDTLNLKILCACTYYLANFWYRLLNFVKTCKIIHTGKKEKKF